MRETVTEPTEVVDDEHLPMYEFDADAGPMGEVVSQVEREPQIEALAALAGEGPTEPDGWVNGGNDVPVPVVGGVPLLMLGADSIIDSESRGAEKSTWHEVDGYGARIDHAGAHPSNTSKVSVVSIEESDE